MGSVRWSLPPKLCSGLAQADGIYAQLFHQLEAVGFYAFMIVKLQPFFFHFTHPTDVGSLSKTGFGRCWCIGIICSGLFVAVASAS
jgi:hypothetical protein